MVRLRVLLFLVGFTLYNTFLLLLITRIPNQRIETSHYKAARTTSVVGDLRVAKSFALAGEKPNHASANQFDARLEKALRTFRRDIDEIGWFVDSQMEKLKKEGSPERINEFLERFREQQRSAVADIETTWLKNPTGNLAAKLTKVAMERIEASQNPASCDRFLHCLLPPSGFGSVLHHVVECLMAAHGTGRVAVVGAGAIIPSYHASFDEVLEPLSQKCNTEVDFDRAEMWSEAAWTSQSKVVSMQHNEAYRFPGPFAPPSVPEDLASAAQEVFEEADVWWTGCFVRYALRMRKDVEAKVAAAVARVNTSSPVVGFHIRRTDKLVEEASYHSLEEYMTHAETWYDVRGMMTSHDDVKLTRRFYVASDDLRVVEEARTKYADYKFMAGSTNSQRNRDGIVAILSDIVALSKCDFVVCTLSSNVCRVVYELMSAEKTDAHRRFHSLDDIYQFSAPRFVKAERDHEGGANELSMKVGDVIGMRGNHWNGYSLGTNTRTGETGLFPSYKTSIVLNVATREKAGWAREGVALNRDVP